MNKTAKKEVAQIPDEDTEIAGPVISQEGPVLEDNEKEQEPEFQVMLLSNSPSEFKVTTIETFYRAVAMGQLAYADAFNTETGKEEPLLVGVEPVEDTGRFNIYPLAKLLTGEEMSESFHKYDMPDGAGGFITGGEGGEAGDDAAGSVH